MLNYFITNLQWIFSGIGVAILGGIVSFVVWLYRSKAQNITTNFIKPSINTNDPTTRINPIIINPIIHSTDTDEDTLLKEIRIMNLVKNLELIDNERFFLSAPIGIYGFIDPSNLQRLSSLRIYYQNSFGDKFELHKTQNDTGYLIGFVAPDTASKLSPNNIKTGLCVTIYNHKWHSAPIIAAIQINRMDCGHSRRIPLDTADYYNNKIAALDLVIK